LSFEVVAVRELGLHGVAAQPGNIADTAWAILPSGIGSIARGHQPVLDHAQQLDLARSIVR
jgi:hypothetical protein